MSLPVHPRACASVAVLALALAVSAAALADRAEAYRLGGHSWPHGTITYHDGTPYHAAVRRAVAAWNASGAHLRFVAVPRRRAAVQITAMEIDAAGEATVGYLARRTPMRGMRPPQSVRGGHVWLSPSRFRRLPSEWEDLADVAGARIVAHELGHVLGLDHEPHRCATMSPNGWDRCGMAPRFWQDRCRILEPDDIRGAVRRYGGRVKPPPGPEFCDRRAPLRPPGGLTASVDPQSGAVTLRWERLSARHLDSFAIAERPGACPATFDQPNPSGYVGDTETSWSDRGRTSYQGGGQYCYALWSMDDYARLSARPAMVSVDVPSSAASSSSPPTPEPAATSSPPPAPEPSYDPPPADPSRPEPPPADCDPSTDPACQM